MNDIAIFNLPIEQVEMRYTGQWARWFREAFDKCDYAHTVREVYPSTSLGRVASADFLDPISTNIFKSMQSAMLLDFISDRIILDPRTEIVVFLQDLWHPVITQLLYLRDMANVRIKIAGCLHAGSYVPHDRLNAAHKWAFKQELVWLNNVDLIIVGSEYHRNLVTYEFGCYDAIQTIPWPVYAPPTPHSLKMIGDAPHIVWPHRYAAEKQPEVFTQVCQRLQEHHDFRVSIPILKCKTKAEYYDQLYKSNIAVSTALEETFGIAMVEAVLQNCIPVVPDDLSYSEMYPVWAKYDPKDPNGLYDKLRLILREPLWYQTQTADVAHVFRQRYNPQHQTSSMVAAVCDLISRN